MARREVERAAGAGREMDVPQLLEVPAEIAALSLQKQVHPIAGNTCAIWPVPRYRMRRPPGLLRRRPRRSASASGASASPPINTVPPATARSNRDPNLGVLGLPPRAAGDGMAATVVEVPTASRSTLP